MSSYFYTLKGYGDEMKNCKVLILGSGAQGSTVAKRMDEEPGVDELICADNDEEAAKGAAAALKKAKWAATC